jgi:hypothetical protein
MFKLGKDAIVKFLKEDLPVIGVDAIIGGVKLAREMGDKAARLIADGTIPAPGFILDKAREKLEAQEDFYRVAEPEHGWDKCKAPEEEEEKKPAAAAARTAARRKARRARRAADSPDAPKPKRKQRSPRVKVKKESPPEEPAV